MATVASKYQSSYRQPGAMMFVDPDGKSFGLVSGGCLEANIRLNARKVLALDKPKCILYDSTDEGAEEENVASELGLGCNGRVEILIQPLKSELREVLLQLLDRMEAGLDSFLLQCFQSDNSNDLNALALLDEKLDLVNSATDVSLPELDSSNPDKHKILLEGQKQWSLNSQDHPVKLWVVGGGEDAQPMVRLAATLGWKTTLLDHRPAFGREVDFPLASRFVRERPADIDLAIDADAVIIMTHSLELDAAWLSRIRASDDIRYIGLLGPVERRREVFKIAGIEPNSGMDELLRGPMGFDIGGDLPESVALSTLAQCHQVLFQKELRREK